MSISAVLLPKIIHQIHLGPKPVSSEVQQWQQTWRRLNPDWRLMFWRDHNVPPLINQDEYDQASSPVEKADILRLEIIMLCGGLYIDTDFECLKPIDPLFEGKERLFFKESAERVCNGIFAACPGDPVVTSLVKGLAKRKETHGHEKLDKRYGPGYITQVVGLSNATDPKYAFPYGLNEKHRKNEDFKTTSPEAYAAHHWAGSWLK